MQPLVVSYLRTHSLNQLKEEHGVKNHIQGHKTALTYDQIESRQTDKLACECRGLVISTKDRTALVSDTPLKNIEVLARPFDRFFNYGEGQAATLDWATVQVQEKLDGTLCILYWDKYSKEWCVGTRSLAKANQKLQYADITFEELFWKGWEGVGLTKPLVNVLDKKNTYLFELTSPLNRVVVEYKEIEIHFLGVRETESGQEFIDSVARELFRKTLPRTFNIPDMTIDSILNFVSSHPAKDLEGGVLVDKDFNRQKIKSLAYLAAAHTTASIGASDKRIIELVLENSLDDAVGLLPEVLKQRCYSVQEALRTWCSEMNTEMENLLKEVEGKSDPNKMLGLGCIGKSPALKAAAFYSLREKKITFLDYLRSRKTNGQYKSGTIKMIQESIQPYIKS